MDNPAGLPAALTNLSLFGRVAWFNSIMDTLELHEKLSQETKQELFAAIFGYAPAPGAKGGYYRTVGLGGYFDNGDPLILYLYAGLPNEKAPAGSLLIPTVNGNFFRVTEKDTDKTSNAHMPRSITALNWSSIGVVFDDGRVVKASYIRNVERETAYKNREDPTDPLIRVNLADFYIHDEIAENDGEALSLLQAVLADPSASPIFKTMANLNLFLYYLSQDDPAKAEAPLAEAQRLAQSTKDIDPAIIRVANTDAPAMLAIYNANRQ
jgi:hypothetical protein